MFDRLIIQRFRSLAKVDCKLAPLSVFIGPNGSGKSNLLDLLSLLAESANGRLSEGVARRGGFDEILHRGSHGDLAIEMHFQPTHPFAVEKYPVVFKVQLRKSGSNPHVWFEQVSKDGPNSPPLILMKRDKGGCIFRSVTTGVLEKIGEKDKVSEHDSADPHARNPWESKGLFGITADGRLVSGSSTEEERKVLESQNPWLKVLQSALSSGEERKILESDSELAIFQVKDQGKYPTPYKILRELQEWRLYRDIDVGPEAPIRQPALIRPSMVLSKNGSNLASVLNSIQQQHPAIWKEIEELLETVYPQFHSITFPPEGGDGKVVLRWWERPYEESGFSANLLSDGTLKFLCLIAILRNPSPPPLICIDEPELGLHPDWIKVVAELLQSAANRTQLIVTTHSPQLVSKLSPEEVVVTEKQDGKTAFRTLSQEALESWLKEFTLGDLWLAGHLGGRP
jgi:predicted ATPase